MTEGKQIKRSVFFISDGTAITAETLGHSLLAQFPHVNFDIHIIPYITTEEAATKVVEEINTRADREGEHFALDNDDGARTRHYDKADLILIGVSRSGKTPTSIYLSLQFGIRVANYPLTEEDLDDNRLPAVLKAHKHKLFGLMIDAERLVAIRTERKANSRYASFSQCQMELRAVEGIYISEGIKYLNVSEMSIEEISTRILQMTGLKRRIG